MLKHIFEIHFSNFELTFYMNISTLISFDEKNAISGLKRQLFKSYMEIGEIKIFMDANL